MINKATVLAVDDNELILARLVSLLEDKYKVIAALGGKVAIKYLENKQAPDIILLDNEMPEINGFDIIDYVKKTPRLTDVPVIFLTASIDDDTEVKALKLGAVDYIQKPIIDEIVLSRINTHLELRRYRSELEQLVKEKTAELIAKNDELIKSYERLKKRDAAITTLLARTTDFRDKITGGHVIRTTGYVKIMVEELMKNPIEGYMVDESTAESIITSAKLHDIGKIAIPDSILTKKSRLSDEEFDMMKKHTIFGLEILENGLIDFEDRNFLKIAKEMILEHHEKWNGKGILLVLRQMKYLFQQEL